MTSTPTKKKTKDTKRGLLEFLEKRLKEAQNYPNIRHAIKDTQKMIEDYPESRLKRIKIQLIVFVILCFMLNIMLLIPIVGIIIAAMLLRKKENKIYKIAFFDPINDKTEDKLDKIFHSSPTHSNKKHHEEFEIFPSSENPWIK